MSETVNSPVITPTLPLVRKTITNDQPQLNDHDLTEEDLFVGFTDNAVPPAPAALRISTDNIGSVFADLEHFVSGTAGPIPSGRPARNLTPQEIQAQITQIRDFLSNPQNRLHPGVRRIAAAIRTKVADTQAEIQSLQQDLEHVASGDAGPLPSGRPVATRAVIESRIENARAMLSFYSALIAPPQ